VDPSRDVEIVTGPTDTLEHASAEPHYGGKMGMDATTKLPEEGHHRDWPPDVVMSAEIREQVDRRWSELGLD